MRKRQPPKQQSQTAAGFADLVDETLSMETVNAVLEDKEGGGKRSLPWLAGQGKGARRHVLPRHRVDLHGLTAAEAVRKTEHFLQNSRYAGIPSVLVITGKGLHSKDGPVVPDAVEELLGRLKGAGVIAAFRWEKGRKDNSGALIVSLV